MPSPQITSGRPCPLVLHAFGCPPTPHPGGAPRFVSKTTKPASPRFAGHTPQPCLAASHTPRIPIRAISSHNHNLTMRPPRPATGSTNYTSIQSRRFPAAACNPSSSRHDGAEIRGVGWRGVSGQAVRVLELNLVATSSFLCQIGLLIHKIIFSGINDMSA